MLQLDMNCDFRQFFAQKGNKWLISPQCVVAITARVAVIETDRTQVPVACLRCLKCEWTAGAGVHQYFM
ncbi:hypothetical protein [Phaeobacter sp. JH18-13]|uniref:hypothetical protein n=1 Tax=Phaeobacter sp. JH18-13 TaxID=3112446 RepID=UPI003A83E8EF